MLAYIAAALGIITIAVTSVSLITWIYVYNEIRHSSQLLEKFHSTARRMMVSMGVFGIPMVVYLFDKKHKSGANVEPYAFFWIACYVATLIFLAPSLIVLIRDAKRERKMGLYRFRRTPKPSD
jgi:hypothetical protein